MNAGIRIFCNYSAWWKLTTFKSKVHQRRLLQEVPCGGCFRLSQGTPCKCCCSPHQMREGTPSLSLAGSPGTPTHHRAVETSGSPPPAPTPQWAAPGTMWLLLPWVMWCSCPPRLPRHTTAPDDTHPAVLGGPPRGGPHSSSWDLGALQVCTHPTWRTRCPASLGRHPP